MDTNQFAYMIEIARTKSLSRAAEKLNISQQGLSLSIKRIEQELNCTLFIRKPTGLELTSTGAFFVRESEIIMEHLNQIRRYCDSAKEGRAKITVACTTNLIVRIPIALRQLLLRGNDDFEIELVEDFTAECERMVADNRANFALVYGPCDDEQFNVTTLDVLKQVFIVNPHSRLASQDSVSLAELSNYPLVIPERRCRPGQMIHEMFQAANVPLSIFYYCDRPQQIIQMVSTDDLAARVILDDGEEADKGRVHVLTLQDDPFLLPVCLIYRKGRKLNIQERFFKSTVTNIFAGIF